MATQKTTFDSTENRRIDNNLMRHKYRTLTGMEKGQMGAVKDHGLEFWTALDAMGTSQELAIAKVKIEEAVMWAVKHITR